MQSSSCLFIGGLKTGRIDLIERNRKVKAMWDQFKDKLKKWFNEEETDHKDSLQENIEYRQANSIETRMSYQYPKERFETFSTNMSNNLSKNPIDIPAFERKKEQTMRKTESAQHKHKEEIKKRPFKPSEVPSPVYGFHYRESNSEKFEDTPAYLRKKESITSPQQIAQSSSNPINDLDVEAAIERRLDSKADATESKAPIEPVPESINQVIEEEKATEKQQKPAYERRQDYHAKKETVERTTKREMPFNVMMTPKDKHIQIKGNKNQPTKQSSPPVHLLNDRIQSSQEDHLWVEEQKQLLQTTLKHFHIRARVVSAMSGPTVTRFEIQPEPGVKVSKIKNLSDDIKLNMAAKDIRIEAPIPGKHTIGIEVPNPVNQPVGLQEIFESEAFRKEQSPLTVGLGLDIAGKPIVTDLQKMPHGLIAGATGSGKSVCINTILISLLYKASHEDVRFLLIDPKMVELAPYNELPHLVSPVITDVKAATKALKWAVNEMEERYEKFAKEAVRDVERYNSKMERLNRQEDRLPYLVIVIDELADLMMVSPQDVEDAICRIAQKARACGIHLLLATQRPSVDVITGLIKANIPTRIAFSVSSQVDSRTIIDTNGAEKLLGKGDMLFIENGSRHALRIQGSFVSDEEIERVTNHVKKLAPSNYLFEQDQLLQQVSTEEEEDEIYAEALDFVLGHNGASASLLQRRFKIGYNRAARLIDQMESNGIISEQRGSKPREVIATSSQISQYHNTDS